MLKVKQVVETEVELPAPDHMEMTWINPTFSHHELVRNRAITIGQDVYFTSSLETWEEKGGLHKSPQVFIRALLSKIHMTEKGDNNVCK